jgi:hypothetical protein
MGRIYKESPVFESMGQCLALMDLKRQKYILIYQFKLTLHCQEVIHVSNQDSSNLIQTSATQNHVECDQNPWQIDGLESRSEPKCNCCIFVELTPNVKNA